jgi:diguanylate cyclase (GGDEF)-like protein/hemerythrin-like metal-binding protein/PAS domain S-box-containing protein
LLWLVTVVAWPAQADVSVRIGVLAFRPVADVEAQWQPLIGHLNDRIPGYRFECKAFSYADLETAIARRSVDFVLTNPSHYLLMTYRNGLSSPLATLVPFENGRALAKFGGVVFTRSERKDIASLENLRGLTVAAVSKGSLGGYQAQALELAQLGIRIPQDVRLLETDMPQDLAVKAVMEGRADAGFVRTGILEDMAREGKLDLAQVKVLAPKREAGFPLMLSTRLYPEWPFAAMPGVDEDLARQVAAVLLSLPHGGELARRLGIQGFTVPPDYEQVRTTLETLRLPPFDNAPRFTAGDIWNKYWWEILIGAVLVVVITLLALSLLVLNWRLAEERRRIQLVGQKWHRLLTAVGEGVYGVDGHGCCTFINPAAVNMLGFSAAEVLGNDQHLLFHHHQEDGAPYPTAECPLALTLSDGKARSAEDWFWRKDGSGFPVVLTTAPIGENGVQEGAVAVFRDVSDRRRLESQLREEATTDPLTGAANRRLFLKQLGMELDRFQRRGDPTALLMVDIDHFKKVNDTHGHATGDAVLRHFTGLSHYCLRRIDQIGRLGGEEFGILLPGTDAVNALRFAERYRRLVAETPVETAYGPISFTISVGIAEFDPGDDEPDTILARADAALYRAKEGGRNAVEIFIPGETGSGGAGTGQSLVRLTWKAGYICGEPTIDDEHRELFRLANALLDQASLPGVSSEAFNGAFDRLLSHVTKHFADEESILRAHDFAQLREHAELHRQLLARAVNLRHQTDEGGVSLGALVEFLVSDVVAGHLISEDRKFFGLFDRQSP